MEEHQAPAEKDTPLSSQVLEYYRNYSQSNQLPRYLCGEVSNNRMAAEHLQERNENEDNIPSSIMTRRPPLIGQDHAIISVVPPSVIITDVNADNRGQLSPTSSITSNRKLEWDNGADIGYENCEVANKSLFRSSSLPALNTLERNIQKDFLRHSPDGRIAETPHKNIIKNVDTSLENTTPSNITSTSTTTVNDNQKHRPSTSGQSSSITVSSKQPKKVFTSSSSSSDSYNCKDQNIIYVPVLVHSPPLAESTPNFSEKQSSKDTIYYETPVVTHPRKPPRKNAIFIQSKIIQKSKSTSFDDLQNLQKLDNTLEQRNKYFRKYLTDRQQNLCITKPASVEYVNKSFKDNISIAIQTEDTQSSKRELMYLDHYVSDKENSSSTDSSKIVDCNSFEYLYGSAIDQEEKSQGFTDDLEFQQPQKDEVLLDKLKHCNSKTELKNVTSAESNSSASKSAKISTKLSNNLITDVEKSVELLTRLLHSKKFDEDTKKYYIRKIVHKIVDSKYVDDRITSTTNSTHTVKTTNESNTSGTPEQYQEQTYISNTEQPLISTNRKIKSETNIQDVADIYPRIQRNPRFTLTNNEFFVGQNKGDENDNTSSDLFRPHSRLVFPSYTTDSSLEKMQDANRSSTSQSWKDDKTASERLIESQKHIAEDSDELVGFAKRERQSQLNWISNEINHLSKLRCLLEKNEFKPGTTQSTAVYMITTDKSGRGSNKQSCNCHNRLNIPNVISASKTPGHHHFKLQRCRHDQQEYKVRQVNSQQHPCSNRCNASCPCHQLCAGRYHKAGTSTTSAMQPLTEVQREQQCNEQGGSKQYLNEQSIRKDNDSRNGSPVCTSIGVTCSLLPSRAAIVALDQEQNICKTEVNVPGTSDCSRSQKENLVFPKSSSLPGTITTSPKKRSAKIPVQSELSNRNVATFSASKEDTDGYSDLATSAKLISNEVYQNNEWPAASVRRYVFEIPIVDLHPNLEASSNFGVNKKENDLEQVRGVDLEVRNVQVVQEGTNKRHKNERTISGPSKSSKTSQKDEMKQLKLKNSEDRWKSVSGKMLSHNLVASFDVGPSISRELASTSSDKSASIGSPSVKSAADAGTENYSLAMNTSIPSQNVEPKGQRKITQTAAIRSQEYDKPKEIKREVSEKSGSLYNKEALMRNAGSQTLSLEKYMQKLIAETMGSNNWSRRKVGSSQSISPSESDKETIMNNIHGKSDTSSRKKSDKTTYKESYSHDRNPNMNTEKKSYLPSARTIDRIKTSTDSDKESFIQYKDGSLSNNRKKTESFRKKPQQRDSKIRTEDPTLEFQRSVQHGASIGIESSDYNSDFNRLADTQKLVNDKEELIDDNISSAVFILKDSSNFRQKSEDTARRDGSSNRNYKPSFQNAAISNTRGSKSSDRPASLTIASTIDETPVTKDREESEIKEISRRDENIKKSTEGRLVDHKNEIVKSAPPDKGDLQSNSNDSKSTSDLSSATTTADNTMKICQCCRSNNIAFDNTLAQAIHHPLCPTCFQIHEHSLLRNHQPFYMYANHICNCYTLLKTQQIQAIKTTINQLQSLDFNQPDACLCPPHKKLLQQDNKCLTCNCPIKRHDKHNQDSPKKRKPSSKGHSKDGRHKNSGISYTLKLDTATEDDVTEEKTRIKNLDRYEEEVVVKVPNKGRKTMRKSEEQKPDKEHWKGGEEKENDGGSTNKETKKNKRKSTKTLQEYLSANRPSFIESAEQRRRCLIELAYMREERCQKYKQLLAMTNGVPVMANGQNDSNRGLTIQKPRIFTTKEMKRLTSKNYKKLPEVQQRLLDNKERQLKKANRLLSDIFNKKLRDKVLKGQPSLSTSVSVINLM